MTRACAAAAFLVLPLGIANAAEEPPKAPAKVSYYKQIRPIFQAQCQGCHQPAKAGGGYVMTSFEKLIAGGDSKEAAILPSKPAECNLIDQITPRDGKAEMPQGKPPLSAPEIELITKWIAEGAVDDSPASAKIRYDSEHPPVYSRPIVIPALDYSPDGQYLAVAGFHEVLLWKADGSELLARLVGLSARIESLRFSPDGSRLAVTGGNPAQTGEIQIWDVAKRKLDLSVPLTFDTVYGAAWSPDGTKIVVGCADNSVRAIDAKTGAQLLFMGSHNDWVLDTAFSKDGSHVVSVGRDMSAKLTEVATQRFIDNITSITPGALKGGILTVARHPSRDEIVFGGSDGIPKLYRIFRQTVRVIGDDSNQIRSFDAMKGRVTGTAFSADGKRIATASSLDGSGDIKVYAYEFEETFPANITAIQNKIPAARSPEETKALTDYTHPRSKLISQVDLPESAVYSLSFSKDGHVLAAAGSDGLVRLLNSDTGALIKKFVPEPVSEGEKPAPKSAVSVVAKTEEAIESESIPAGTKVVSMKVEPLTIKLADQFSYVQVLVYGQLDTGEVIDITRMADHKLSRPLVDVSRSGIVRPMSDGQGVLTLSYGDAKVEVPVTVNGMTAEYQADFVHDVNPVLSRLGCNQGTCHGSAQGKNGFKLSLRGYDPIFDVRAFTDDHASRRVNLASPDDSLMLQKPAGAVPHVGGQLMHPGEPYYEILRNWIARGARLKTDSAKVAKIEVSPTNPIVQRTGLRQQMRILATYTNGEVRDVTREAFIETGNGEVATANRSGLMTAIRRGEAPILARFEGAYAATTLTVMGDRNGFVWEQPPTFGKIDELVASKWQRLKIRPSEECGDAEFLRRIYLDLTGLPPTPDEVRAFLADNRETRIKRNAVIDKLIGSKEYIEYWTNKWADLLQVNRKFLGVEGAVAFRGWIRDQVARNVPYDQFVTSIMTASGSNKANPPASYFKILRDPTSTMENTTQLFLSIRFNCNKCHDHPFERWTQDQYYQTAAYFAQFGLKGDPASNGQQIGATDVEAGKPLFEEVYDTNQGEVKHDRTGKLTPPQFPFEAAHKAPEKATRRQELVSWLTAKDNPYFARGYVNRLWGYLCGVGIIEPLDDVRAGNPPSNPELLDYLTEEFIKSGFNAQHLIRLITQSRTYQLSVATNKWNEDDKTNFSHAMARRLPAEVLYDAVYRVTGAVSNIPGVAAGTRAAELPDSGVELPSGFLTTFGRPVRESACECERSSGLQLGPVMALVSGPTIGDAIADPNNEVAKLTARESNDTALVNELFVRILNRQATPTEIQSCLQSFSAIDGDHVRLAESLGKRETEVALARPQQEREREATIVSAKAALAAYEKELAPKTAELEKQRQAGIAKATADLQAYEAGIPAKLAAWEKSQNLSGRWQVLNPTSVQATGGTVLTKEADASIVATGANDKSVFTIVAETDLTGITGVRLEALSDDRSPRRGPGRAGDGNFVLTEVEVVATSKVDPKQAKPVGLQSALADFTQGGFDVNKAVDGDPNSQLSAWAVSPATGATHWATFETKEPVGFDKGTVLTIRLHQNFAPSYQLGRFRLSVTRVARPVGLGLPDDLRAILATVPEVRSEAQKATLLTYFRSIDPELAQRAQAVGMSQAPLPVDARLKELRDQLEAANQPLPVDGRLAQLRRDVEMSVKQAAARRLTAAQDVAWALINSPAFLFNH
ncbi:DUF1549 domain-containing protein [Singulisphaera sp. PoT]|uniref:DUF1549 domain-containing protein n=1 Tax=Singulisphaera sp. PoT TaxID=3411797 RepID=UPI003BF51A06